METIKSEVIEVEDFEENENPPQRSLLKYAHHLHYARLYDREWAAYCETLTLLLWPNLPTKIWLPSSTVLIEFEDFPNDVLMIILSYFDAKSLCAIAMTCRLFHEYASNEKYWEHLLISKFNLKSSQYIIKPFHGFKAVYRTVALSVRNLFRNKNSAATPGFLSNNIFSAMHGI